MKQIFLSLAVIFVLMSCNNKNDQWKSSLSDSYKDSISYEPLPALNRSTQTSSTEEPAIHPLTKLFVDYVSNNQDISNNALTRSKAAERLQSVMFDTIRKNPDILKSVPFKYDFMLQKGNNKYIVKFALSRLNKENINHDASNDDKYSVAVDLFTIADESFAEKLKDGCFYKLKSFKFDGSVNGKITLPSGRTFTQNPSLMIDEGYSKKYQLILGGIYVKDIDVVEWN